MQVTKLLKIATTIFISTVLFKISPALAWKPTTHVYLAEQALKDALDNEKVVMAQICG